ncbi:exopolyphosphatase [Plectosphaerella plurivora]|uniref:Exopolyphosphatase n=1 Tax=Plectosphaerella plurivora TaxID=936078 RepID=A0A9P9AA46_9PEZI|nr:exopolyphosphatase [Plectosphaerella plurivora]
MPPRASLGSFLANARAALTAPAAQRANPLTFVVGNESADLDSLCSTVIYAYLRTTTPPNTTLHIPLSNLPRADLALRPELTAALAHAHIKPSDLLTLDELPASLDPANTRWFLVDHNALTGTLSERGFDKSVIGCIDHHTDENKVPLQTGDEPRIIEKTGSCASLLTEYFRPTWENTVKDESDAHIARLALAPILADTANLKAADRTTPKDVEAVEFLGTLAGEGFSPDALFNELNENKENLSALSLRDIFRKDYKQWREPSGLLGTSASVRGLDFLLNEKAGGDPAVLADEFQSWATEKGLDVAAIMTSVHDEEGFRRELLVWALNENGIKAAEEFLRDNESELQLEPWGEGQLDGKGGTWRRAWRQGNVLHSRKRVAPMLRESLQGQARL